MAWFLKLKYFFLIIVISFFSVASLLHKGFPPSHDGEYHVVRFYEFDRTLRDGNWFPRWAPDLNHGFGVPLFNYVYPLPNYIGSFFHLFGFSFIDSFKLSMFVASIIGATFFYLWARNFWGDLGGLVSAAFYTYSPYHFVDIYIRGSIGEVWALALFPAFLWAVTKFYYEKKKIFVIFAGTFLSAIICSHNILALMFFPFALLYLGLLLHLSRDKRRFFLNSLYTIILGISLSAIFWLPAIMERKYVEGLQIFQIGETFPELYQFIFPSWGSGFADSDLSIQMSFQIGVANLLGVFVSMITLIVYLRKREKEAATVLFFLSWFFFIFFLMNRFSLFVWKLIPLMNYFQFPWRFLSIEILVASFLAGTVLKIWPSRMLAALMIFLVFALGIGYAKPAYYHNREDSYYTSRPNFIQGTNSPADFFNTIWMNRNLKKEKEKIKFVRGEGEIKSQTIKSTDYYFNIVLNKDSEVIVNTAYFPGWTVSANGERVAIRPNEDGLISFSLPKGTYDLKIKFADTIIRKIGTSWSLLTVIFLGTWFAKSYYVKIRR